MFGTVGLGFQGNRCIVTLSHVITKQDRHCVKYEELIIYKTYTHPEQAVQPCILSGTFIMYQQTHSIVL